MQELDYLILGAGWTSTFLIPVLKAQNKTYAATTTTGRDSTLKFKFDPSASDQSYLSSLPTARNILITFPLTGTGQSKTLVEAYQQTHHHAKTGPRFMQLGSSGIFQIPEQTLWVTRTSSYDKTSKRAVAEDELLALGGCVLNLSGLWGGERDPKKWVDRVASSKEQVKAKTSLHMVHGEDVARAVFAAFEQWDGVGNKGQRWLLTDGFVYDWWALMAGWAAEARTSDGGPSRQSRWVFELMEEEGVKALPRSMEVLGRCYDSREFWQKFGLSPVRSRI